MQVTRASVRGRCRGIVERVRSPPPICYCAVIIIHHCGVDATRPRGHTSLTGAVMSQLAVRRLTDLRAVMTTEWAKDFGEGAEVASALEIIEVGTDPDGDLMQALTESGQLRLKTLRGCAVEKSDHRHRRLLRPRRDGPCCRSTTKNCDEFPSPHGFTRAEDYIGCENNITFWIENCAVRYNVRFVPKADSCTATKRPSRSLRLSAISPSTSVVDPFGKTN